MTNSEKSQFPACEATLPTTCNGLLFSVSGVRGADGAARNRARERGASMDVAVACIYPTLFSLPINVSRGYHEANQGAILLPVLSATSRENLRCAAPAVASRSPPSILNACANECGYLKMGTKTDSPESQQQLAPCLARSGVVTVNAIELRIECLTFTSGVSTFTRRCSCFGRSARISMMTRSREAEDSIGRTSAFVNDITKLHTLTKETGTLIEWMTKLILMHRAEVPFEKNFGY